MAEMKRPEKGKLESALEELEEVFKHRRNPEKDQPAMPAAVVESQGSIGAAGTAPQKPVETKKEDVKHHSEEDAKHDVKEASNLHE